VGRLVYRNMRLSQSLTKPYKQALLRTPPAGGSAESARSRWPILPGKQEFRTRSAGLGKSRLGEWERTYSAVHGSSHRCAGSAASAVAAGRCIAAVLGLLVCRDRFLRAGLGFGKPGMRPRGDRVL